MIRRHKVLYNSSSAGTGDWVKLDSRYEDTQNRSLTIKMNASDTIKIEATTLDAKDVPTLEDIIEVNDIVELDRYTGATDVDAVLFGNYTFIRVVKIGVAGTAKVQGYV